MGRLIRGESKQRAYPNLLDNSVQSVMRAFKQAFDYIYQLEELLSGLNTSQSAAGDVNSNLEDTGAVTVLNTVYQDIGCSVTLNKDGTWLVIGSIDGAVNVQALQLLGQLMVDGVAQPDPLNLTLQTGTNANLVAATISKPWTYVNVGTKVAKLQAKVLSVAGVGAGSTGSGSKITAIFLHA